MKKSKIKWDTEHFDVAKSTVKGAGNGLFAKVKIRKGDTIGEYTGKVVSDRQAERKPYVDSDYILWVCEDHNIVGEGPLSNHTRYINHSDKPNTRFVVSTRWKKARVEATKTIKPGQELFVDYGPHYWEAHAERETDK